MYLYTPVHTTTSTYHFIPVCAGMYQYIPVHTSTYQYILVCTGTSMCCGTLAVASHAWVVWLWRRLPCARKLCERTKPNVLLRLVGAGGRRECDPMKCAVWFPSVPVCTSINPFPKPIENDVLSAKWNVHIWSRLWKCFSRLYTGTLKTDGRVS